MLDARRRGDRYRDEGETDAERSQKRREKDVAEVGAIRAESREDEHSYADQRHSRAEQPARPKPRDEPTGEAEAMMIASVMGRKDRPASIAEKSSTCWR